jgi:hypothetical protein
MAGQDYEKLALGALDEAERWLNRDGHWSLVDRHNGALVETGKAQVYATLANTAKLVEVESQLKEISREH